MKKKTSKKELEAKISVLERKIDSYNGLEKKNGIVL